MLLLAFCRCFAYTYILVPIIRGYTMQMRDLGKTGIQVSAVGLGGEHLDRKPQKDVSTVINAALDGGVNIIDVFMPGAEVRTYIGRALGARRKDVIIQGAIGSTDINQQYDISRDLATVKKYFSDLLTCMGTDYIDLGMLFFMDTHEDIDTILANGVVDYARQLKKDGVIRAIGATVHNPDTAKRLVREEIAEVILFSINPAFDLMAGTSDIYAMLGDDMGSLALRTDPERTELYRLCEAKGVGITVMKSLGAGKLLTKEHTPFAQPLTPVQCIQYALTRPAVSSVLVGAANVEQLQAALAWDTASAQERDYSPAISGLAEGKKGFAGSCVYCSHCQPCPAAIDIAAVNRCLDIALLDEAHIPDSVRTQYAALPAGGDACVQCGQCEQRCPFSVPVITNMQRAAQLLQRA